MIRERVMWIALLSLSAGVTMLVCLTLPAIVAATFTAGDIPAAVAPLSAILCVIALVAHATVIAGVARSRG
ncbi:hypothetical protein ACO03V_02270 [Microbacterium sp. HMH0099]|uniref:hypothetical protein n=1 Tax=Microbacterium sp. HMH0099 TaxID=3414026 RepID=UPI003BF66C17